MRFPAHRGSMKFHVMAIAIICFLVVVLYALIGPHKPKRVDDGMATGDRYISIYSASWGLNCNAEITRLKNMPITLGADGTAPPPLKPALPDNALMPIGNACNGRLTCNVVANSTTMETDPLPNCFKELQVSYRCFNVDRLWTTKINQNETLKLDCNEAAEATRK